MRIQSVYWTVGPYDAVALVEAPDDETAAAALLQLGGVGNARTTTLRAFGREEMDGIIAKAVNPAAGSLRDISWCRRLRARLPAAAP